MTPDNEIDAYQLQTHKYPQAVQTNKQQFKQKGNKHYNWVHQINSFYKQCNLYTTAIVVQEILNLN